ncbi:MAG: transglycosylase SLT domain-containing protein [Dysgonamonadaceae bacterium]|jgi:membrane-bound lytic murein transglycosylase D|nr:transglycosylase SLT domain-containing protein [Dysgonamonadaceae bacterium]
MKKVFITIGVLGIMLTSIHAQGYVSSLEDDVLQAENDTISSSESDDPEPEDDSIYIPESLEANVDSLLRSWHVNYHTNRNEDCMEFERDIDPSDSVYIQRLNALPKIIEMPYNQIVKRYIQLYTGRSRRIIQYMLGLADYYFPSIEQILDENELPLELKYLVIVESALNPTALSHKGASGLWQFILPTGKIYGLEINSLVDERRDPIKATYAACRYLKDMYAIYGDWNLVIASYNCGPGNVNKAIRRSGGKKDYWAIYKYLPKDTRSYIPLFIGATYAMNYYKEHNICPVSTTMPLSNDTVMINRLLHLDQVAQVLKIDIEQLKALNPEFKKGIIPGNYKPYALRLPTTLTYAFIESEAAIYAYNADQYFPNKDVTVNLSANNKQSKITHKVSKGETMLTIANNYGVTTTQIKSWNRLKSVKSYLNPGRNLTLYVNDGGLSGSKASTAAKAAPSRQTAAKSATVTSSSDGVSYYRYKVKKGDSFYAIARRYPGVNVKDLMRINNIEQSTLKIGQIIKIPTS